MTLASVRSDLAEQGLLIPVIMPEGETRYTSFTNRPARYASSPDGEFYVVTLEDGKNVLAFSIDLDFTQEVTA